jgi:small subunit ribosomal protein S16
MLKIRLKRVGRKHDPSFRVVLVDSHEGPKTGKINEILGFYDAKKDVKELKAESIKNWMSKGAQVSDTVHNLLVDQKIITGKKINVLPKKRPVVKEVVEDPSPQKEESKSTPTPETAEVSSQETPTEEIPVEVVVPEPTSEAEVETPVIEEAPNEVKEEIPAVEVETVPEAPIEDTKEEVKTSLEEPKKEA